MPNWTDIYKTTPPFNSYFEIETDDGVRQAKMVSITSEGITVKIFGEEYKLNAEVVVINAFSGHADQTELLDFVSGCLPLKGIFLVHGELEQSSILADILTQKGLKVHIPDKDEEVLLS